MKDFIELRRYSTLEEAEIVKGFLESKGIEAYVEDRGTHIIPETIGDLAVFVLFVKKDDFEKANKLLEEKEKED